MEAFRVPGESLPEMELEWSCEGIESETSLDRPNLCCDSCGSESLTLSAQQTKPSWSVLLGLDSQCSPWWYAESQEREEKRLWDKAMGEGFYDWYIAEVKRPLESARGVAKAKRRHPIQLSLPGMGNGWQWE